MNAAILGGGFIGKVHAYAYATLPFYSQPVPMDVRVKYMVCAHAETAERAAARVPGAIPLTDWRQALADPTVEIVNICTPNDLHCEMLEAAITAQKHIYCEKPLVANAEEAERIAALLPTYRGVSHMAFHTRYFASAMKMKAMIEDGQIGEVLEFRGCYMQNSHVDLRRPIRWKNRKSNGGGALADIGSHLIDFADWLAGPLTEGQAIQRCMTSDADRAEDTFLMLWKTAAGAVGSLHVSKAAHGTENTLRLEIYGTRGALRFDLDAPHFLDFCDGQSGWTRLAIGNRYTLPDTDFPATKSGIGWVRAHCTCLADFLRCVAAGRTADNTPDLQRGVEIQRKCEQLKRLA